MFYYFLKKKNINYKVSIINVEIISTIQKTLIIINITCSVKYTNVRGRTFNIIIKKF